MANDPINRRQFIARAGAGLGALAIVGSGCFENQAEKQQIKFKMAGANHQFGHRLRELQQLKPKRKESTGILIIGGGISGLACSWWLRKKGYSDFKIVELEAELGGNSRSSSMEGMKYPLGAHYLPIPALQFAPLVQFLEECKVIKGYALGLPVLEEAFLCHSPHERLKIHGTWQNGLVPNYAVPQKARDQISAFHQTIEEFKAMKGQDGREAFCIPHHESSKDAAFIALDQMSMKDWLDQKGWDSDHLHWFVNYCCRDDFGTDYAACSAWAGIHYFAARKGKAANAGPGAVLTWPEGNAWLSQHLQQGLEPEKQLLTRAMACQSYENEGRQLQTILLEEAGAISSLELSSQATVFAGPQFVAARLFPQRQALAQQLSYAPWMVANVRLKLRNNLLLKDIHWDNVGYGRSSLGYVHAGHQLLHATDPEETVITWYEPITEMEPKAAREALLNNGDAYWQQRILDDLEYLHPGISAHISAIEAWPWGHAMVRPVPGLLKGNLLEEASKTEGRVVFAHSDLSGMSIFEEAFRQGIRAAEEALSLLPS